ncbi:hypothetical protein PoB_004478400 [Plakobranchus ocellatus]|uniref:Uncharacterized protein n=1 Tax=Plakobranchus ocellatus TaxID=259542 RepID=A0AAV4BHF6_9GAST|nr:hypothetical protein PoB_004478400 [Plakobranchus ocellatus]
MSCILSQTVCFASDGTLVVDPSQKDLCRFQGGLDNQWATKTPLADTVIKNVLFLAVRIESHTKSYTSSTVDDDDDNGCRGEDGDNGKSKKEGDFFDDVDDDDDDDGNDYENI